MKNLLLISTACLAMTVGNAPGIVMAEESGFYIGVSAGYNLQLDQDLEISGNDQTVDYEQGAPGGLVTIGVQYQDGWRAELEGGYRASDVSKISGTNGTGDVDAWTLMVNGLYDFDAGGFISPYLGVGAGLAYIDYAGVSPVNDGTGTSSLNDFAEPNIAFQAIAGVSVALLDDLSLTGQYNALAVPTVKVNTQSSVSSQSELYNHMVTIGLRYSFSTGASLSTPEPEPMPAQAAMESETVQDQAAVESEPTPQVAALRPPPPEPAPQITRNFVVYFDWDNSSLTTDAQTIIQQAASYAEKGQVARIILFGHTDTSGAEPYNLGLSQARAESVRNMLVKIGQPASGIITFAQGERKPLVETADGVREAKNRRVEIFLE